MPNIAPFHINDDCLLIEVFLTVYDDESLGVGADTLSL
jgi:hypothetical protein